MINRAMRGFSLLEAIAVIIICGIIVAAVAVFMQRPIQGYFSSTTRAAMADTADTALRRIGRDVRLALPNTVRVGGGGLFLELIPIKTGGRYQQSDACFSTDYCGFRCVRRVTPDELKKMLAGEKPAASHAPK